MLIVSDPELEGRSRLSKIFRQEGQSSGEKTAFCLMERSVQNRNHFAVSDHVNGKYTGLEIAGKTELLYRMKQQCRKGEVESLWYGESHG